MWVYRTRSTFRQMFSRRKGDSAADNELLRELDALHDYFGAQVALYFAFATQLMMWLTMPAIIGLAFFITELLVPRVTVGLVPAYCTALMLWATLFAEYATRRKEILVFRWGGIQGTADADDEAAAGVGGVGMQTYRPAYKRLLQEHGIDPNDPDPVEGFKLASNYLGSCAGLRAASPIASCVP
ncbi:calcium-activated chloride channel-domain-containing protein [Pavlovales sp. CCMP2436]|nr:calcium-activated chloride channel-domain-containing protein [Pavlovales sp. CCMP2436]